MPQRRTPIQGKKFSKRALLCLLEAIPSGDALRKQKYRYYLDRTSELMADLLPNSYMQRNGFTTRAIAFKTNRQQDYEPWTHSVAVV
ncbi:MAG: hypothetical protein KDD02_05035 [Phaeodactylibacter sp.]|nr:hypothetical protein [Phaeodactylibacter sp.]MCB9304427.1 hypothetical protein [Lewinellaceae bacterium]